MEKIFAPLAVFLFVALTGSVPFAAIPKADPRTQTAIAPSLKAKGKGKGKAEVNAPILSPSEKLKNQLREAKAKNRRPSNNEVLMFDLPVTYNKKVSHWISYYQVRGQKWFREWLVRGSKFLPYIQRELKQKHLPLDLSYMVMIESGFSPFAKSVANAVGPWQFIRTTGERYGLRTSWWLDERRDLKKSTLAAARYIKDLYSEFGSWYLVIASYNMGENGLRRQTVKHGTKDYWQLIQKRALPTETQEYVPKILAAMLIAKAPNLYGFRNLDVLDPLDYDMVRVKGGLDLDKLAGALGVTRKSLRDLNAELVTGYVPQQIKHHEIKVPKGAAPLVSKIVNSTNVQLAGDALVQ